jgi:hypothetical protein
MNPPIANHSQFKNAKHHQLDGKSHYSIWDIFQQGCLEK